MVLFSNEFHSAFEQVLTFLHKQNRRPFLKRYLKRDEIQQQLTACDASLNDALGMFGVRFSYTSNYTCLMSQCSCPSRFVS